MIAATPEPPEALLLTRDQVARLLAISPEAVRTQHRLGRLPGVRVGRVLRWRRADVERFVARLGMEGGGR